MNRENKFRAWDIEKKRLISSEEVNDWRIGGSLQSELFEIMQFTGLKDKNGVEIYEGDIFWSDHSGECTYVEYQEGAFYIIHTVTSEKTLLSKEHGDWIIRGNIYENPELLEVEV